MYWNFYTVKPLVFFQHFSNGTIGKEAVVN